MPKPALEKYAAKRQFKRTPEPPPVPAGARRGPLMFVVQKHAARRLHYDLRLELDGVLKSWAVPKGPSLDPADKRLAVEVEDHPFDYASFEGVIPEKEYGAGNVIVWDCGVYSPDEDQQYAFDDRREAERRMRQELEDGKLSIMLRGEKLKGSYALVRTSTSKQWLLIKHKDRYAQPNDVLALARSVLSDRSVDDRPPTDGAEQVDAARLIPHGPAESMPTKLAPMLAEIGEGPRSDGKYLYEPKLDGYRAIAFIRDGKAHLQSRRGLDLSTPFPELIAELAAQAVEGMILDGEIVALGSDGRPSFNALQNRVGLKTSKEIAEAQAESPALFMCFDLLHFAGVNLRQNAYVDRHRYLAQCLLPSPHLQLAHVSSDAESMYAAALAAGFEGIVAKRRDSAYQPGRRSSAWLKIKAVQTAEFVVGGYTSGQGARQALGALLLGYWQRGKLNYAGHVGSGFNAARLGHLQDRLAKLSARESPFASKPPLHRPTTWVKPEVVVEVKFAGWTPDGYLRAPVFLRVREDKPASEVREGPPGASPSRKSAKAGTTRNPGKTPNPGKAPRSGKRASPIEPSPDDMNDVLRQLDDKANRIDLQVGSARIRLTNLDRVYWPGGARGRPPAITKRDLLRYLTRVSPHLLRHLANRPLTMIRMPDGIDGDRFFQKHWRQERPEFVESVTVFSGSKDEEHEYLLASNLPTLLWLGQVGTLEFHVWHSRAEVGPDAKSRRTDYSSSLEALESSVLNYPDYLVFDIDPYIYSGKEAKGAEPEFNRKGFAAGRRVAFWLRELLQEMSLEAVVKTSGKTGLHVFVPIERTVTFDEARTICEMVGRHLLKAHPKEITLEWATVKRTGKIFIDYNMNVRGKTLNVAFSPRGVPGAPVSMPLTWEELEAAEPPDFTIGNAADRLDRTGDRWHDVFAMKQSLAKAFASVGRKRSG
jgi:bifunctional non-homologous end joining protein LigD